jgi:hypothetical protein
MFRPPKRSSDPRKGQAMAEFVIWVFVLLIMISGIIWFGKSYELKLKCHMASRYLAWSHAQIAETGDTSSSIVSRVSVYYPMSENAPELSEIDPADIYEAGSLNSGGPTGGGLDIFTIMGGMFNVADNINGWNVGGTYAPGGILDDTLPDGTHVQSQHFVSGGTWHKKQVEGDVIIVTAKTGLFMWSMSAL